MAAKSVLNVENLETLGARRLAELLIELSNGDAVAKRNLRNEIISVQTPGALSKEVRKRLAAIRRSRSYIEWQGIRPLADDLEKQLRAILDKVSKHDPKEAYDLLWQFVEIAKPVFERCDDSSGRISDIFRGATQEIGRLALSAKVKPKSLADAIYDALQLHY